MSYLHHLQSPQTSGLCNHPSHAPSHLRRCSLGDADPHVNRLLRALPAPQFQRWLPDLEAVDMPVNMVLAESGRPMEYAYFPTSSILSRMCVLQDGHAGAVSIIGNEGVVGLPILMGGGASLGRTVVIKGGQGFRLSAAALTHDFEQGGPITWMVLRYLQAVMTQVAQSVVCNRHHTLDRRLCRFLLATMDRLDGDNQFVMTHDLIAAVLGVRRERVTEAAVKLQRAGLMNYQRGRITVFDRAGLERRTCECHAVVKKEYDRLLPADTIPHG